MSCCNVVAATADVLAIALQRPDTMATAFTDLGLAPALLAAIDDAGYEAATAIQARTIPALLSGRDLIGQAQTGTGKTAAFALPILQTLEVGTAAVQALVLTPTCELAIQVAEAIHTYSKRMGHVRALPVYGGQPMSQQIRRLKAGVHVVVGTPGRIMDHLRRGTLRFDALRTVVLDEADEMLRMGFIDDVEWILGQMPAERQTALFSATMPPPIKKIAERHLRDPERIEVERTALTLPAIEQRYLNVTERQKLDALTRVLEVEAPEAALVFVRTKTSAADVGERLQARGYAAEAMHGDMTQAAREQTIRRLRGGQLEIVVATDVAARGLDVERITHVVNYDVPHDAESYVHRIGRTGRAGRAGTAILFVTPRETRPLRLIERFTGHKIAPMRMPSAADVAARRASLFKQRLREAAADDGLEPYLTLVEEAKSRRRPPGSRAPASRWRSRPSRRLCRRRPTGAWSGCSSTPGGTPACDPPTSSAPSRARRAFRVRRSAPSTSTTASRSSKCPRRAPTRS
jgi:ATP-dependent RNA helicase DeaD